MPIGWLRYGILPISIQRQSIRLRLQLGHMLRLLWVCLLFLTVQGLLVFLALASGAAPAPVRVKPMPEPVQVQWAVAPAENQYVEAKAFHARLVQDESFGRHRENWLAGVRQFRKLQLMHKNEELSAGSLFMLGRMYRQMFERFQVPLDLDNAIDSFQDVAGLYPKNSLADDALYNAAEVSLLHPVKKQQAKGLLRKIGQSYAGSDHAQAAAELLNRLSRSNRTESVATQAGKARSASLQEQPSPAMQERPFATDPVSGLAPPARSLTVQAKKSTSSRVPQGEARAVTSPASIPSTNVLESGASSSPPAQQAWIEPVKYWSSDTYTRIVIPASAAVPYTTTLQEKRGTQPYRLFVDFAQSMLVAGSQEPVVEIDDGLIRRVRSSQHAIDTVRIVLDMESLSDYTVFSLPDPFRVVVDVHGTRASGRKTREVGIVPQQNIAPQVITEGPEPSSSSQPEESMSSVDVVALQEDQKKVAVTITPVRSGKQKSLSLAQQLGLGVRHIVIDPGHGGKDPGAIAFGLKEKDVVLRLAKMAAKILQDTHGYQVSLTRTKDVFLPLEERTAMANTKKADLFLSLHLNAHPDKRVGGVETYFLNLATDADAMRVAALENATSTHSIGELQDILQDILKNAKNDESSRLAQYIHRNLATGLDQGYKIKNLGVKQAPFYVLIGAEMPAVLIEVSFITNPKEAELLQKESYLLKIAEEIVNGLISYVEHHHSAALQY